MKTLQLAAPFTGGMVTLLIMAALFRQQPVALIVTLIIAGVFILGFRELQRFTQNTATLKNALHDAPACRDSLQQWLAALPAPLRQPVQQRIDGHSIQLPGPVLTPFLTGLLVMLGLLGTFIGMIVTLQGAATALDGSSELSTLRGALSAPISGLSLAFGTSIAGVAASAMLGLAATLCRRERVLVARLLDDLINTALSAFSLTQQREDAYTALREQSKALPSVVNALHALTERMEAMGNTLTNNQQGFHDTVSEQYQQLTDRMGDTLQQVVTKSSEQAIKNLQPLLNDTLAGLGNTVVQTHEKLATINETQFSRLNQAFRDTTEQAAKQWQQGLQTQQQTSARLVTDISTALASHTDQFEQNSNALLKTLGEQQQAQHSRSQQGLETLIAQFSDTAEQVTQHWRTGLDEQQSTLADLLVQFEKTQHALAQTATQQGNDFAAHTERWLSEQRDAQSQWQTHASEQLSQLQDTAREHLTALGTALEAPMARLIETASETPKAAAEVITRLKEEIKRNSEQENALLDERQRLVKELDALLRSQQDAMTQQQAAIEQLVNDSANALAKVRDTVQSGMQAQGEELQASATEVSSSAAEVASLSDAFTAAVEHFSNASDALNSTLNGTLTDDLRNTLQQVEDALVRAAERADEQLAYYVAQAREVIELTLSAQQGSPDINEPPASDEANA